jgi:hypothetical protein
MTDFSNLTPRQIDEAAAAARRSAEDRILDSLGLSALAEQVSHLQERRKSVAKRMAKLTDESNTVRDDLKTIRLEYDEKILAALTAGVDVRRLSEITGIDRTNITRLKSADTPQVELNSVVPEISQSDDAPESN